MAIVNEFFETTEDGIDLYRTYSDENKFIHKKGTAEFYEEAIDSQEFEYEETNIKIESR